MPIVLCLGWCIWEVVEKDLSGAWAGLYSYDIGSSIFVFCLSQVWGQTGKNGILFTFAQRVRGKHSDARPMAE